MKKIPSVTVDQMREVDRIMVEEIGVSIMMMMENASRNIAILSRKLLKGSVKGKTITVLCGKGNNGGDGLGAARHLTNFGAKCRIILATSSSNLRPDAKRQLYVLEKTDTQIFEINQTDKKTRGLLLKQSHLIIDALLGYNLIGNPKEPIATIIKSANQSGKQILAVDIPSGLSGDSGKKYDPTIKAHSTITLALPKVGLLQENARIYVGNLYLTDLSVPKTVYNKIGINVFPIFEKEEIIRIN